MKQKDSIACALRTVGAAIRNAEGEIRDAEDLITRSAVPLAGVPSMVDALWTLTGAVETLRDQIAAIAEVTE